MADIPKRGDPLIEVRKDALGKEKLIATDPFQRYLEDLNQVAEVVDTTPEVNESKGANTFARLITLEQRIGSGNPLTSDETGFTVDSTTLSVDMTEA